VSSIGETNDELSNKYYPHTDSISGALSQKIDINFGKQGKLTEPKIAKGGK